MTIELPPDARWRLHHNVATKGVGLAVVSLAGGTTGRANDESRVVIVTTFEASGRTDTVDFYDAEQLDTAFARFDGLVAPDSTVT